MVALMAKIDPTFEIVTMTPEWALDLLANNIHQNRKIKRNQNKIDAPRRCAFEAIFLLALSKLPPRPA